MSFFKKSAVIFVFLASTFSANANNLFTFTFTADSGTDLGFISVEESVLDGLSGYPVSLLASGLFSFEFTDPSSGLSATPSSVIGDFGKALFIRDFPSNEWIFSNGLGDLFVTNDLIVWIADGRGDGFGGRIATVAFEDPATGNTDFYYNVNITSTVSPVPELSTLSLMIAGLGFVATAVARRRRKLNLIAAVH